MRQINIVSSTPNTVAKQQAIETNIQSQQLIATQAMVMSIIENSRDSTLEDDEENSSYILGYN